MWERPVVTNGEWCSNPGGGGYMTCGWTGVCRPVFRKVPSSNYRNLRTYPLLWWNLAENHPFFAIFRQFLDNPPLFKENLPKKGPLFREFGAQKPTHMGGTYPYPQHVMYPPPPPGAVIFARFGNYTIALKFNHTCQLTVLNLSWILYVKCVYSIQLQQHNTIFGLTKTEM